MVRVRAVADGMDAGCHKYSITCLVNQVTVTTLTGYAHPWQLVTCSTGDARNRRAGNPWE